MSEFVPDFACPELEAVIRHAIEYSPAARTQTMTDLRAGLERARAARESVTSSAPMLPFRVALEQAQEVTASAGSGPQPATLPRSILPKRMGSPSRWLRSRVLDLAAGVGLGVVGTLAGLRMLAPGDETPGDTPPPEAAPTSLTGVVSDEALLAARQEGIGERRSPTTRPPASPETAPPRAEPDTASERPLPTMREALDAIAGELRRCSEQTGGLLFVDFKTAEGHEEFVAVSVGAEVPQAVHRCVADATRAVRFQPTTPMSFTEEYML